MPPLRVAIVGSGPSGFYAAGHLLNPKGRPDLTVEVDMFDRLPTPWGLVRGGVAPDHPNIKAVSRVYEKTAAHSAFRFFGAVEFGTHLGREDLLRHYHAVIYAVGAQTDRRLGIPGEDLRGSHPATDFVGWYNGHPDYRDLEFDLNTRRAVVIGNGNVALDVARMLVLTPAELELTDVADHALDALRESALEEIVVIGRRGPAQAAFTNPELLELGELAGADVVVDPFDAGTTDGLGVTARRNVEILDGFSRRARAGKPKAVVLRFLASPVAVLGEARATGVELAANELDAAKRAIPTGERETLAAGIVFRSVGYRGVSLPGVPFDAERGVVPNDAGRVAAGEYATGWIKRGPSGVIGTNKKCAQETVATLLADLDAGGLPDPAAPGRDAIEALVRERRPQTIGYAGWEAIDAVERAAGEAQGRPRVKLCDHEALLAVAHNTAA